MHEGDLRPLAAFTAKEPLSAPPASTWLTLPEGGSSEEGESPEEGETLEGGETSEEKETTRHSTDYKT